MSTERFATFTVDGMYLGIDIVRVREVLRPQRITPVALAAPEVAGLLNLRGEIVTAIDLRRRLGLPDRETDEPRPNVVVSTDRGVVSLLVDQIGDVVTADERCFELPPETLRGARRTLIRGAYKLPDRLLLELDLDEVLAVAAV